MSSAVTRRSCSAGKSQLLAGRRSSDQAIRPARESACGFWMGLRNTLSPVVDNAGDWEPL